VPQTLLCTLSPLAARGWGWGPRAFPAPGAASPIASLWRAAVNS